MNETAIVAAEIFDHRKVLPYFVVGQHTTLCTPYLVTANAKQEEGITVEIKAFSFGYKVLEANLVLVKIQRDFILNKLDLKII